MIEKYFTLKQGSRLYDDFVAAEQEKDKFATIGKAFLDQNSITYQELYLTDNLTLKMDEEAYLKHKSVLRDSGYNVDTYSFRKNSKINKKWEQEVVSQIDLDKINKMKRWAFSYILNGKANLFIWNDVVYGMLLARDKDELDLPDFMIPIQKSEYYAIVEQIEKEQEDENNEKRI